MAVAETVQNLRRVLIATDFSPHADSALVHAMRFAEAFDAELHVLSVTVPYESTDEPSDSDAAEEEGIRERLGDLDLDRETGDRTVRVTRKGLAAAPAILEYAEEAEIDLIAMGSHGRRGLRRLLLGSVTEEVLRAGRWPVLTVHGETSEPPNAGYRRILAPVDFSKHTRGQVDACVALAERFGCGIELVHVVDPPIVPELYMPLAPLVADAKKATERATGGLEDLAAPLRPGLEVDTEVLIGSPASEIARSAEAANLIVMPTHGYSGLDRVLLGSVAEGVLRRVDCAVLVLRPPD